MRHDFANVLYLSQTLTAPPALRMKDIAKMITALSSNRDVDIKHLTEYADKRGGAVARRYTEIMSKKSSVSSYGEKRWFFTITILALTPDLIILDEPTAGVDPEYRHYIWQCIREAAESGAAVLISSHNIEEICMNCDCFYMLSQQIFSKFENGQSFIEFYGGKTLDEAFIFSSTKVL